MLSLFHTAAMMSAMFALIFARQLAQVWRTSDSRCLERCRPDVGLGNSQIMAALYAPNHDVTINGGGSNGHFYGSIVGKTVTMNGVTNLHYDEAMGDGGLIDDYRIVSWFEDNR